MYHHHLNLSHENNPLMGHGRTSDDLVALPDISTVDSSRSCASVLVVVLDLVLDAGGVSCSSFCWVGCKFLGLAASSCSL